MTLSRRQARSIRRGIVAARMPSRLQWVWIYRHPLNSLAYRAFERECENAWRFHISINLAKDSDD